ncbi:hypothetical protein F4778DRAFT_787687 [Xylariomycetidae sp. FL2044]|nr:hypothetical protein F4778DRAFT_787687 [Xylariomycetidae sp. FL2044]
MVRDHNPSRDQFPARGAHWYADRFMQESMPEDTRFLQSARTRPPPMVSESSTYKTMLLLNVMKPIDRALSEHCHINADSIFVVAVDSEGDCQLFSAGSAIPVNPANYVDIDSLRRDIQNRDSQQPQSATSSLYELPDTPRSSYAGETGRRRNQTARYGQSTNSEELDEDVGKSSRRKRPRQGTARRRANKFEDRKFPSPASTKKTITIGSEKETWDFYEQRFKNCQQNFCKIVAKAWIKLVEPKKQSTHPYTKSEESQPEWWPKRSEMPPGQRCRHIEPDHSSKDERVYLLCHILKLLVQPNFKQHTAIRHLGITIEKLEYITWDALSSWFADKNSPNNLKKKPFLKEIFKVARIEEQYKDGGRHPTDTVYVMSDDRVVQGYVPEDDDDDTPPPPGDEMEQECATITSTTVSCGASPHESTPAQSLLSAEPSPSTHLADESFTNTQTSVRSHPYNHHAALGAAVADMTVQERPSYLDESGMAGQLALHHHHHPHANRSGLGLADMYPGGGGPQDSSRRSSTIFASPTDYTGPATPTMYAQQQQQQQQQWHSGTPSAFSGNPAMYAPPHAASGAYPHFVANTMASNQQYHLGGPSFDSLPRGGPAAEAHHHGTMSRTGTVGHSSGGFTNYMTHDPSGGGGGPADPMSEVDKLDQ